MIVRGYVVAVEGGRGRRAREEPDTHREEECVPARLWVYGKLGWCAATEAQQRHGNSTVEHVWRGTAARRWGVAKATRQGNVAARGKPGEATRRV